MDKITRLVLVCERLGTAYLGEKATVCFTERKHQERTESTQKKGRKPFDPRPFSDLTTDRLSGNGDQASPHGETDHAKAREHQRPRSRLGNGGETDAVDE